MQRCVTHNDHKFKKKGKSNVKRDQVNSFAHAGLGRGRGRAKWGVAQLSYVFGVAKLRIWRCGRTACSCVVGCGVTVW
jgi:hypothetical protein